MDKTAFRAETFSYSLEKQHGNKSQKNAYREEKVVERKPAGTESQDTSCEQGIHLWGISFPDAQHSANKQLLTSDLQAPWKALGPIKIMFPDPKKLAVKQKYNFNISG